MASKFQFITELYSRTLTRLTGDYESWTGFLRSACYNYKCPFDEQVLIYAQRPDATAVLELEKWNRQFGRWVNAGATGIAVIDEARGKGRLKHYFDITDTHATRISRPVPIWSMEPAYTEPVIETLEATFGTLAKKDNLPDAILSASRNAAADNMPDYLRDLLDCRGGSMLEELDALNVEVTYRRALQSSVAYVAINLSFACSLRIGEIVGLTWDNIHISDADIANDNAYLCVEKELARVKESSLAILGEEEIIKKFPRTMYLENASTVIVLKTPKTESSVRKVWMPKTVAYILREWKDSQDKQKEFLGDEYLDYNLVVALPNGRPCEETVISNAFRRLKRDAKLPNVVFHSLRHSSTTYKLKLNHGDIKATQGDTGHSQADMVTKVYAHILDEDRKVNAQKFESAFYANPDLRSVKAPDEPQTALDVQSIIVQLHQSPELLSALTSLISNQGCK